MVGRKREVGGTNERLSEKSFIFIWRSGWKVVKSESFSKSGDGRHLTPAAARSGADFSAGSHGDKGSFAWGRARVYVDVPGPVGEDKRGLTNYLVLVHVHRPQVRVEEQLVRLDVDGTLPPPFAAEGPLGID